MYRNAVLVNRIMNLFKILSTILYCYAVLLYCYMEQF